MRYGTTAGAHRTPGVPSSVSSPYLRSRVSAHATYNASSVVIVLGVSAGGRAIGRQLDTGHESRAGGSDSGLAYGMAYGRAGSFVLRVHPRHHARNWAGPL